MLYQARGGTSTEFTEAPRQIAQLAPQRERGQVLGKSRPQKVAASILVSLRSKQVVNMRSTQKSKRNKHTTLTR